MYKVNDVVELVVDPKKNITTLDVVVKVQKYVVFLKVNGLTDKSQITKYTPNHLGSLVVGDSVEIHDEVGVATVLVKAVLDTFIVVMQPDGTEVIFDRFDGRNFRDPSSWISKVPVKSGGFKYQDLVMYLSNLYYLRNISGNMLTLCNFETDDSRYTKVRTYEVFSIPQPLKDKLAANREYLQTLKVGDWVMYKNKYTTPITKVSEFGRIHLANAILDINTDYTSACVTEITEEAVAELIAKTPNRVDLKVGDMFAGTSGRLEVVEVFEHGLLARQYLQDFYRNKDSLVKVTHRHICRYTGVSEDTNIEWGGELSDYDLKYHNMWKSLAILETLTVAQLQEFQRLHPDALNIKGYSK